MPAPRKTLHQEHYLAPPLKGLIRLIAKAVVEDYRKEISMPIRLTHTETRD